VNPEIKGQLLAQAHSLAAPKIPSAEPDVRRLLMQAVRESYLGSFREVTLIAALLAVSGALVGWMSLKGARGEPGGRSSERQMRQWYC
jgi:hypothetical protein